jgi:proteasome lid subunit RPN8/RPN11
MTKVLDRVCKWFDEMRQKKLMVYSFTGENLFVSLYDQCLSDTDLKTNPTRYPTIVVGMHSVTYWSSATVKWTFPMLVDCELRNTIVLAGIHSYREIMQTQDTQGKEITGVVVRDTITGKVNLVICETNNNTEFSSQPFCNAHRTCKVKENQEGQIILGEFHTHPKSPTMNMTPPSDADLYQLLLAAHKGQHNMSCVFTPEGLYICVCSLQSTQIFGNEIEKYFNLTVPKNIKASAWDTCKQPVQEYIDVEQYPYLHCLFNEPQKWYLQMGKLPLSIGMEQYIRNVFVTLHITIFCIPPPATVL